LQPSGQARRGAAFRIPPGSKDSNGKEESAGAAGRLSGYFFNPSIHVQAVVFDSILLRKPYIENGA
jgi:hypothetical protein